MSEGFELAQQCAAWMRSAGVSRLRLGEMEIELDPNFRPVGQLPAEPEGIEGDPLDPLEQLSAEWDRRAMPKQKLSVQEEGEDDDEA